MQREQQRSFVVEMTVCGGRCQSFLFFVPGLGIVGISQTEHETLNGSEELQQIGLSRLPALFFSALPGAQQRQTNCAVHVQIRMTANRMTVEEQFRRSGRIGGR